MILRHEVILLLNNHDWKGAALVDLNSMVKTLEDAGFRVHEAARNFLKKYGGLKIAFVSLKYDGEHDEVHFIAERTAAICDLDDIIDFGNAIGVALCPVGEINRRHSIVAIADDGRVFSFFSPFVTLQAFNFEDAMNNFFVYTGSVKTIAYEQGKVMDFPIR